MAYQGIGMSKTGSFFPLNTYINEVKYFRSLTLSLAYLLGKPNPQLP